MATATVTARPTFEVRRAGLHRQPSTGVEIRALTGGDRTFVCGDNRREIGVLGTEARGVRQHHVAGMVRTILPNLPGRLK